MGALQDQLREDEYRDCPFEMYGKQSIIEQRNDIKELVHHIQGIEIARGEDTQKLINVVEAVARIEGAVEDVKRLVREVQTTEPPVDTFKAVMYDLALWLLKIASLGGILLFVGDKIL